MTAAAWFDQAREALQSARHSAVGPPGADRSGSAAQLAHVIQLLERAVESLRQETGAGNEPAAGALLAFRSELSKSMTLHQQTGLLCSQWMRALAGLVGDDYTPHGADIPAALVPAGLRVWLQA